MFDQLNQFVFSLGGYDRLFGIGHTVQETVPEVFDHAGVVEGGKVGGEAQGGLGVVGFEVFDVEQGALKVVVLRAGGSES